MPRTEFSVCGNNRAERGDRAGTDGQADSPRMGKGRACMVHGTRHHRRKQTERYRDEGRNLDYALEGFKMKQKIAKLIDVKSIVTLLLSAVFAYLAIARLISGQEFLTVFSVVIAFYFGTQAQKSADRQ